MIKTDFLGKELKSEAENVLLANDIGGYFYLSERDFSKYQGLFFNSGMNLYKTLDKISLKDSKVKEIIYNKANVELRTNKGNQKFFILKDKDVLVYESDSDEQSEFVFDCRESYDMDIWGRNYEVFVENGAIIIKYHKKPDFREKGSREYETYTAIVSDNINYDLVGKWVRKDYIFDNNRFDVSERYAYEAISLKTKKAAISCSLSKEEAIANAKESFEANIKKDNKFKIELKTKSDEINYAYNLSLIALESLKVNKEKTFGIYAGLPWFFQFWTRDSVLSSKAIYSIDKNFTKKLLLSYIDNIREDGLIPNRMPSANLDSIDGVGLVFFRISRMLSDFSANEINYIYKELKKSVSAMLNYHSRDSLILNNELETWMDTESRAGIRIEVQALFLNMLSLLEKLAKRSNDRAFEKFAIKKQDDIIRKIKKEFYFDGYLYDGVGDPTQRPNVFLAHYFYPELLKDKEWEKIFDNALKEIWLDWGGLSTISKKDIKFCDMHTGMNNRSYHNGDSWFFVNNMAALCMDRLNKKRYGKYVKAIVKASTNEILHLGIFGFHAELSSARQLESNGCLGQAWSSALYIEMIDEIYR